MFTILFQTIGVTMPTNDHNFVTIALFVLSSVGIGLGFLIKGWFTHVNMTLDKLWERLDSESKKREDRWNNLHIACGNHAERIAKLEGRLSGKDKVYDALGELKVKEV